MTVQKIILMIHNDRELTREGKDRIESLKEEIGEYQEQLEEIEDDPTIEEELVNLIEELEERIEDVENDDDYYEYGQRKQKTIMLSLTSKM